MIGRGYLSTLVKALKAISFSAAVAFQAALYWSCSRQALEERWAVHSNAESEGVVGPVFQRWNEEDFGGVLSSKTDSTFFLQVENPKPSSLQIISSFK